MTDRFRKALRLTCQQIRSNLSPAFQRNASKKICTKIRANEQYRYAKRIALYQAVNGEINLADLWESAPLQGKSCFFPALNDDKTLSFLPATPVTPFLENRFGIAEPDVDRKLALSPGQLDIVFMPLVGFDEKGTRLGMGAGYYDRTLATKDVNGVNRPLLIGVAYEFQRLSFIEAQPWDIPLPLIITEQNFYWCNS